MSAGATGVTLERPLRLTELAAAVSGRLLGGDAAFQAICTDTRSLAPGQLYVALRGARFDGHDFIAEARARGAAAALVERPLDAGLPLIVAGDTRLALGRLAAWWRGRYRVPVAGITGSNGKTTVKEMLARILSAWGEGVVTHGNLNNEIGVPLTLLRLGSAHRFAVIEMGASRPGDIAYLSGLVHPDAAVVTNAGPAHLAGFGDIEGVARAKGEIFSGLGDDGVAVINDDDPRAALWLVLAGERPVVRFGLRGTAEVRARALELGALAGSAFELVTPRGSAPVRLRVPGRHNVMNALAAAALAHALGASLEQIVRGLEGMPGVEHRLQPRPGVGDALLIDDTYNANPGSVAAALEVLAGAGTGRETILVLGDMGELGEGARALHEQIGHRARELGIARLYAVGELAAVAAAAFGPGARPFASHEALTEALRGDLEGEARRAVVLIKGSRSMRMERVAEALASDPAGQGAGPPGRPALQQRYGG
jgi:UDP-N-acetylmuramoyl-tripeptide--D-alanyl-D-alanine ligase